MALLGALVNGGHTVIDHELLTHEDGKRVAAFGWYAGGQLLSWVFCHQLISQLLGQERLFASPHSLC